MNSRQEEFPSKKESDNINNNKLPKITSSRQWSNYKNPRIVRVSRAFGGKDRHSKVCTVRGLRDRRIRLSVPTAIQLYDLQERLGLNQPSKVVDWLIEATKHDIDKLPPLPMLPQFQDSSNPNPNQSHVLGLYNNNPTKEMEKNYKWINHEQSQDGFGGSSFVAQNLFPLTNIQSSFPNLHWDPSSLSLSQFGGGFSFPSNTLIGDDHHNVSTATPSSSQLYLYPSATNIPPIIPSFPSYFTPSLMDNDFRQINHQNSIIPTTLNLISSPMKALNFRSVYSQENDTEKRGKEKRSFT